MSRRERFKTARNFAIYYGSGQSTALKTYDIAIVEPAGQEQAGIKAVQEAGTLVLAYLSVMEINQDMPEYRMLKNDDFLALNGEKIINEEYGNFLVDLCSQRWRNLLAQKAARLLGRTGYDGLFLDTIGDVEDPGWPGSLRDTQLMAAVNIVNDLRGLWPGHILVQNCGLERLASLTAGLVDGICWENPPVLKSAALWVKKVTLRLVGLKQEYSTQILVLSENRGEGAVNDIACKIAREHGFLFYSAPENYLNLT